MGLPDMDLLTVYAVYAFLLAGGGIIKMKLVVNLSWVGDFKAPRTTIGRLLKNSRKKR